MGGKRRERERSAFRKPVEKDKEKLEWSNKFCGTSPTLTASGTYPLISGRLPTLSCSGDFAVMALLV